MAKLIVISWRDVPSQVVARQGRDTVRVQLSARFQEAVDRAAMRAGKGRSEAYIADWKRGDPRDCGGDLKAEAIAEAARLEALYSDGDLEGLIRAKGIAPTPESKTPEPVTLEPVTLEPVTLEPETPEAGMPGTPAPGTEAQS